ncbi:MAG: hydantoinase/carbamoylase family amidase [Burkholderiaceae bacterium]
MSPINIDGARLLADLAEMRRFGAIDEGGVSRTAFSDADVAARRCLAGMFERAGLRAVVDPAGNLFGLPVGDGPALLVGSHSDSQPRGGWLDGIYGVLAGLELSRAAGAAGALPVAVVAFQDEEGWFGSLNGSAIWSGEISLAQADLQRDVNGVSFADARLRAGEIAPLADVAPGRFLAFIEPHIEQGPVLDASGEKIGVVDTIVGMRGFTARFVGQANHAGTTPMTMRRDALRAMAAYVHGLEEVFAPLVDARSVWTCGRIEVAPNAPSIVPALASVSVQMRDPDPARLDRMREAALRSAREIAESRGLEFALSPGPHHDPRAMHTGLVQWLERAAERCAPARWRRMPSGALHDALNVASCLPSAVIFVPSLGGISHSPAEDTAPQDLMMGVQVLAAALAELGEAPEDSLAGLLN